MKKLLSLLSVLTISGSAVPTIIAASPYQNKKTNNLKKIIRVKRQNNNDKLEPSIDTENEIGEITEEGLLWGRNHKCYFIKLTPIFWREIINLYNNYYEEEFSKIIEKKIKKEFKDFFDMSYSEYKNNDGKRILMHHWSSNYLGEMIYNNWNNINNEWEKSNKTKRIRILFNFYSWESTPDNTRWMEIKYIERTFEWYHNYISANIENNYDEYENRYDWNNYNDNYKINNLKSDFKDFNKYLIDLGIIDDNENKTILDSLRTQNRNLDISQLEIIKKEDYSQLKKRASAQIKFKIENKSDRYPKIFLKPKLVFITRIKIQEISNQIENANLFQQWNSNFNQWKNEKIRQIIEDVPKYGQDERGQALERTWTGELLTQINNNLLSLNHILETIDNRFQIHELNNTIEQEVKNLKENINNLRNDINEIRGEIWKITNPDYDKKINSSLFTFITRISKYITFYYFPTIWSSILIFDSLKEIFSLMTSDKKNNITTKNKNSKTDTPNNLDNKERDFDYSFQNKINDGIKFLLNNINQYDVPADGSCLFWSVATAYLLPFRNNNEEFRTRFIQLFGEEKLINLSHIQNLLQQFNLENHSNNQLWYNDETSIRLVTNVFRNRVVNYIIDNLDNSTQQINSRINQIETFRNAIQISENIIDVNEYLEEMRNTTAWGGEIEILGISNFLNSNISVNNNSLYPYQPFNQNSSNTINIFHVNGNHYNFGLENQNINRAETNTNTSTNNNIRGGGQSQLDYINLNPLQLQNNEYHFLNQEIEQNSLKNDENLTIYLINNENKIVKNYNSLSKEQKQQKLNEINQHYQNLSENNKKFFKDKLKTIGTSAIGAGISVVGTKITLSSTATTSTVGAEAMEMTPLLSEGGLTAAETLSVTEGTAVVATEGAVIGTEAVTAAALAPETLGLSLVIGGLVIAGTAILWWINSDHTIVKHESHNQYNEIEKYYKFLAHDQLKLDININEWNKIKQIYQENSNNYQEFKNKIKSEITNFHKEDHSGWGGSINDEDINTLINIIYNHFQEINNHFLSNPNHGWKIITNTVGSYFIIDEE
ncbi:OTU domain-containing protein [Spiroplasma endosymbiont of Megaselia nigra]|uniref:OTU domain-containing protein n=1 Tax=Spiroplasma endosymbiont of Megaselia nigra TaxID=2478537 RepID=UPI000F8648C3|nr:OTU domain-containing protein [Spiroplasma endosymbiont of Megaselia nigra]RUO86075.1 hypothetical protein D9R21_05180 [Spiroplasma endosymbiont of Megaselia nigra]